MWRSPLLKWKTQEEEQVVRDHIFKDVKFEMLMRPQAKSGPQNMMQL